MNYIYGKFNEKIENVYLTKFSSWRYKFFQFLEKVYKKLISNKDGRVEFIRNYISKTQPQMILEIGSGTLTIYPFLKKTIQRKFDYYISEINPVKVNYLKKNILTLK